MSIGVKEHIYKTLGIAPDDTILGSCIPDVCLRIGTVLAITGLAAPTIYREISQGRFPHPIKITAGARAWKLSEVMEWMNTREREGPGASIVGICTKTDAVAA
jgi:prophage regulatory protein